MKLEDQIKQLLGRPWVSFTELYGAVRRVVGPDVTFDCFEEVGKGVVVIRRTPIGKSSESFNIQVKLNQYAVAA